MSLLGPCMLEFCFSPETEWVLTSHTRILVVLLASPFHKRRFLKVASRKALEWTAPSEYLSVEDLLWMGGEGVVAPMDSDEAAALGLRPDFQDLIEVERDGNCDDGRKTEGEASLEDGTVPLFTREGDGRVNGERVRGEPTGGTWLNVREGRGETAGNACLKACVEDREGRESESTANGDRFGVGVAVTTGVG
ncbi:hypothetical protein BDM02DRAFT_3128871 [Thelephora ganbajun]|uniref:Uncharacterized protein n=1 Tax=Thelephora ganbajun TaxID=370292 RepID=A0ACB6ZG86_THEGA|nr:hypothetical protein BDM02DRAFT_3128871 [Thelephora ganbajun]